MEIPSYVVVIDRMCGEAKWKEQIIKFNKKAITNDSLATLTVCAWSRLNSKSADGVKTFFFWSVAFFVCTEYCHLGAFFSAIHCVYV